jgi:phage gp36-like protein
MAYCTLDDLKKIMDPERIRQLTDDNQTGSIDQNIVDAEIEGADAEINGYCQEKYTVPLSPVPTLIKELSKKITRYRLYMRRGKVPEEIQNDYKNCVKILENIARGLISLGASEPTEKQEIKKSKELEDRIFDDDAFEGY